MATPYQHSNTTLVKVKLLEKLIFVIFIILLKVLMDKDFSYFLPAIMRFEGI